MIEVSHLTHRFGTKTVLHDINLKVHPGEIVAVMGASGGGKTTLLRCITGLITPSEGEVTIDDVSVRKSPEVARTKLGLVFQSAALFDYLSVRDNVAFGLKRQRGSTAKSVEETVRRMLDVVGLAEAADKMPSELSGGMKKRVGLARALAMNPSALLYDEPTSGLDPVTAYSIDHLIVDTRNRLGVASVVVSHDISSVFRVADKVAFLDAGHLVFFGTPADMRQTRQPSIDELLEKARAEKFSVVE